MKFTMLNIAGYVFVTDVRMVLICNGSYYAVAFHEFNSPFAREPKMAGAYWNIKYSYGTIQVSKPGDTKNYTKNRSQKTTDEFKKTLLQFIKKERLIKHAIFYK